MKISPWAAGVMKVAVLSAAFAIPGTAMASAAVLPGTNQSTSGNNSILGGTAANVPVSAPIDVCGNAVGLVGSALGLCQGGASVSGGSGSSGSVTQHTSGNGSILGGTAANVPVKVPVDACGNAVGNAAAECQGGANVGGDPGHSVDPGGPRNNAPGGSGGSGVTQRTSGNDSILGGTAANAPISLPVNLCGNAVALLGQSEAACAGGASVTSAGGPGGSGVNQRTSGNDSIAGGTDLNAPISAPINVCGNAVAVLGSAVAGCKGGASVTGGNAGTTSNVTQTSSGNGSILGGSVINAPISAPINVCGNAIAVLGSAQAGCKGGATVTSVTTPSHPGRPGHPGHPGRRRPWRAVRPDWRFYRTTGRA